MLNMPQVYIISYSSTYWSLIQRQRFSVLFSETRSHGRFPAQLPLDGRGQLSWDEVRPRVAARRRDVEVLLSEGPGAGMINLV